MLSSGGGPHDHRKTFCVVVCALSLLLSRDPAAAEGVRSIGRSLPARLASYCVFTHVPSDPLAEPSVLDIPMVPRLPLADAIWGATGRDDRGHVWFGVSMKPRSGVSGYLLEYIPETKEMIHRGDVISELRRLGLCRDGEKQPGIHTKILQAADGHLYFASTDLSGGDFLAGTKPPTWGGHLWRLRLPEYEWEHLIAVPEGLVAIAGSDDLIYACGFFGHKLYQYNIRRGEVRSVQVGSVDAHFTRNIVSDCRNHVYVPRLRRSETTGESIATLVEYDTELREVGQKPLPHYIVRSPNASHGITAFQPMVDGSIIFATSIGFMYRIVPREDAPAELVDVGWFHPDGPRYVPSLFTYAGERYVMGLATGSHDKERLPRGFEWVVHDLATNDVAVTPVRVASQTPFPLNWTVLYGSVTRDNAGHFYVVGRSSLKHPVILQVQCQ